METSAHHSIVFVRQGLRNLIDPRQCDVISTILHFSHLLDLSTNYNPRAYYYEPSYSRIKDIFDVETVITSVVLL